MVYYCSAFWYSSLQVYYERNFTYFNLKGYYSYILEHYVKVCDVDGGRDVCVPCPPDSYLDDPTNSEFLYDCIKKNCAEGNFTNSISFKILILLVRWFIVLNYF